MIKVTLASKNTKKDSQRRHLFQKLITKSKTSELVEEKPDHVIYFDTDLLKEPKVNSVTELLKFKEEEFLNAILDITEDLYEDEEYGSVLTLCTVCAGFITCSNATLQEAIYNATGRLAYIVGDPILETMVKEPDTNEAKETNKPYILWFGMPNEIFTVRQEQVDNKFFKINTCILHTNSTNKQIDNAFNKADILYLPKTFDELGEDNRAMKVQLCLMEGKFVVAPDLPIEYSHLAFNGSLKEGVTFYRKSDIAVWIKEKQNLLLEAAGLPHSLEQFTKALELAPNDEFLDNLGYFLENEEISL